MTRALDNAMRSFEQDIRLCVLTELPYNSAHRQELENSSGTFNPLSQLARSL